MTYLVHASLKISNFSTFPLFLLYKTILYSRALLNELEQPNIYAKFNDTECGNQLLVEFNEYLAFTGSYEPLEQVFLTTKSTHHIALFLFLFTTAHLSRLQFMVNTNSLLAKNIKDSIDGTPLLVGLLTVLQQFHKDVKLLYLTYLCQYVTVIVEANIRLVCIVCTLFLWAIEK